MTTPAVFLLGTLGIGGSERKFVRLANALAVQGKPVHVAWLGPPDTLATDLDAAVDAVPLGRRGKYLPRALHRLTRLLRGVGAGALVNVNFYPLAYSAPARALAGASTRLLASINTTTLEGTRERRFMALYAPLLRRMDRVVFGCKAQEQAWCRDWGIDAARSAVVYNGCDPERFAPPDAEARACARARFGLDGEAPVAAYVAQMRAEKGHEDLLRAMATCKVEGLRLVLAGDGAMRPRIERLRDELALRDRVVLAGELDDVRPALAAADVFVLPSRSETFSNAALEASAMGLPVVHSDVGGARELVDEGVTGLVTPARDPAALALALETLFASAEDRRAMGRAGRERAQREFSFGHMLADWERLLWPGGGAAA